MKAQGLVDHDEGRSALTGTGAGAESRIAPASSHAVPPGFFTGAASVPSTRAALLGCIESALTPHDWERAGVSPGAVDAVAHRLLERWQQLVAGRGGPQAFERRLAARGLDRERALRWLAPRALPERAAREPWARALLSLSDPAQWPPPPAGLTDWSQEERAAYELDSARIPVFPRWLHPFVGLALARLAPVAREALAPGGYASIARAVLVGLSHLASRVLAAEIGRRGPEAPAPDAILDVLARHPVLARLLAESALACAEAFSELLLHARDDAEEIGRTFNGGADPGGVCSVIAWRSDPHRGARSAAFVRFASGVELVYKPRSHAIDLAFARFAQETASAGAPGLRLPRTLARGDHGWSERVRAGDCADAAAVGRYRERQGCVAALVYFLCGMDFHYENFIACGEWPVPIDLEGLMCTARHVPSPEARGLPRHFGSAAMSSVLASSMGTYWRTGQDDRALFTASGIAGCGERLWPQKAPGWEGSPDAPRLVWQARRYEYRDNLPRLAGKPVALDAAGIECVRRGFRAAYGAILSCRDALLAPDGALAAFARCPTRVILRDTSEYASVLFWSLAPAHLASGRAYAVAMEALSGEVAQYELAEAEVLAEDLRCCLARDVPLWRSEPESRTLLAPSGRRLGPVVPEAPLDQARARIEDAGAEDLEYQSELLRASLAAALATDAEASRLGRPVAGPDWNLLSGWSLPAAPAPSAPAPDDPAREALAFARRIGDTLAELALRLPDGTAWLGLSKVAGNATQIAPVVAYPWSAGGAAGTGVLFANLFHAFGDPRYAHLARSALALCERTCRALERAGWWKHMPPSAYNGEAFPIYALAECARLLGDETLVEAALESALQMDPARLAAHDNPDWLGGVAGTAAVLAYLGTFRQDARLAERERACMEAIARAELPGGGFAVPGFERPLLGMAHGATGVAAACARVHAATGDADARAIAERALAFERERFDAQARDWPDLRREGGTVRFMSGWCAGPAGAGLARLVLRDTIACDDEIEQAIANTRERMGIDRHHACCGESGRILFLAEAAARLDRPELRAEALAAACKLADFHREAGFLRFQEYNDRPWTPGLLDGAAGVALALVAAAVPGASDPLALDIVGGRAAA